MKTLIIQSYRARDVPSWIARCLASVRAWADAKGYDYRLTDDSVFALCGDEYLAQVGDNKRSITNLCRLELVRQAHQQGYDWAVWIDADVFVFDAEAFSISEVNRYAFARETWLEFVAPGRLSATSAVNNCVFVCRMGEPDLDFLLAATRHVAMHRVIADNYQVGGSLIKGLRASLAFETLSDVGMFSDYVVMALARDAAELLQRQARFHGTPVHAANLCASENYANLAIGDDQAQVAMDRLEESKGDIINRWLGGERPLAQDQTAVFTAKGLEDRLGH